MRAIAIENEDKAVIKVNDKTVTFAELLHESGALFSDDDTYRYLLWRVWNPGRPRLAFIMLNPSTADESANDNTIDRCVARAKAYGYGTLIAANIFALRSMDPMELYKHPAPIGPLNDGAIGLATKATQRVVCGWGGHGLLCGRGEYVARMLRDRGVTPYCLDVGKTGQPKHPLYLPYKLWPRPLP